MTCGSSPDGVTGNGRTSRGSVNGIEIEIGSWMGIAMALNATLNVILVTSGIETAGSESETG